MTASRSLPAFTLIELLVVLVIFGIMLLLSSGMTQRARDTFIAQQYIKTAVQNARILRRKSMLITRNSSENAWVQGIGFRFEKEGVQWRMTQVKALSKAVSNNYFYQSFPTGVITCLKLDWDPGSNCTGFASNELLLSKLENTTPQILPEGMSFEMTNGTACDTALTILYESINGKLHAYCRTTTNIDTSITPPLNIKIYVKYFQGGRYKNYLNLKDDGEINVLGT